MLLLAGAIEDCEVVSIGTYQLYHLKKMKNANIRITVKDNKNANYRCDALPRAVSCKSRRILFVMSARCDWGTLTKYYRFKYQTLIE